MAFATLITIPAAMLAAYKTIAELKRFNLENKLERQLRVHERQIEVMQKLYVALNAVLQYSRAITKPFIVEGEDVEKYPELLNKAWLNAHETFTESKLLIPGDLVAMIDSFFNLAWEGRQSYGMAKTLRDIPHCEESRAEFWKKAGEITHEKMPSLLSSIESHARKIIHSAEA